jgi:hypothetical protein
VADEVGAFRRGEEFDRGGDEVDDVVEVGGRAARRNALSLAKASSMGLKSGLYGGRKRRDAPAASIAVCTSGCLWGARLSATTMSPGRSPGTSTYQSRPLRANREASRQNTAPTMP